MGNEAHYKNTKKEKLKMGRGIMKVQSKAVLKARIKELEAKVAALEAQLAGK